MAVFNTYNNKVVGKTNVAIDALQAYTQETNGANLQADAAVYKLESQGIDVDFHLSGAMSNRAVATSGPYPKDLKVSDMFTLMPYENSLVVMEMNGPHIKRVLERAYRNYLLQVRVGVRRVLVLHDLHARHRLRRADHV